MVLFSTRYADQLPGFYSRVMPTPLQAPYWVCFNQKLADAIHLPVEPDSALLDVFSGRGLFEGHDPIAQKYAGHQFGGWNPDLGDGRGLLLGEWTDQQKNTWELHLKGAGKTPYSRFGDGRAVLRSSVREMIGSEAMHALGIPSTRALGVIGSKEQVVRETIEPGATLLRVTQSHIRFGHFEWFAFSNQPTQLQQLVEFAIEHHFPQCDSVEAFFEQVMIRTANMIAGWMAYGFVHGVMNTDNMSILGETFDYGPYAFVEQTKLDAVFNHSDPQGRYAFHQQPMIGLWNLQRLAHSLSLIGDSKLLAELLKTYQYHYLNAFTRTMTLRFGGREDNRFNNDQLIEWLQLLAAEAKDYHQPLRELSALNKSDWMAYGDNFIDRERYYRWLESVVDLVIDDDAQRKQQMLQKNPAVIARTHHLQSVIEAAHGNDFEPVKSLLNAVQNPFEDNERWQSLPRGTSTVSLSCSS